MFGELVIGYLFLGGVGSGACLARAFVMLASRRRGGSWLLLERAASLPSLVMCAASLAVGCVCLLKDLAQPGQALLLLIRPTWSAISVGAFALGGLLVCLLALVSLDTRGSRTVAPRAHLAVEIATALLAAVVATYTGLLLFGMASVPLWTSPFLPVLFVLSSLSSGIALVLLAGALAARSLEALSRPLAALLAIDAVLVVAEALCVVGLVAQLHGIPAADASFARLAVGDLSALFWIGFVACGLALPLLLGLFGRFLPRKTLTFYVIIGMLALVGAFCLRWCTVEAGVHLSQFMFEGL